MSVTSNEASHLAFGPILEGLIRVKFNDINEIRQENILANFYQECIIRNHRSYEL